MPGTNGNGTSGALRLLPATAVMGVIFALSSRSALPPLPGLTWAVTAIVGHFAVYALLAAAVWWGLPSRFSGRWRATVAFVGVMAYGATDEIHQSFVTGRSLEPLDLVVDAAGAACALLAVTCFAGAAKTRFLDAPR